MWTGNSNESLSACKHSWQMMHDNYANWPPHSIITRHGDVIRLWCSFFFGTAIIWCWIWWCLMPSIVEFYWASLSAVVWHFMCFCKVLGVENVFSQMWQIYDFPSCFIMCSLRLLALTNPFWQMLHLWLYFPLWCCRCFLKFETVVYLLSHTWHAYDLPSCFIMWSCKWCEVVNPFWHLSHLNLKPVWCCMCFWRPSWDAYILLQIWHLWDFPSCFIIWSL